MKLKQLLILKLLIIFFTLSLDSYASYENETLRDTQIAVAPSSKGLGSPGSETSGMNQGFSSTTPSSKRLFQNGEGEGANPDNDDDEDTPPALPVPDSLSLMLAFGLSYFLIKKGHNYLTSRK